MTTTNRVHLSPRPVAGKVYRTGERRRQFTFVVETTVRAAQQAVPAGAVMNIAGSADVSVNELLVILEEILGKTVRVEHLPAQPGDVERTGGDGSRASLILAWSPEMDIFRRFAGRTRLVAVDPVSRSVDE